MPEHTPGYAAALAAAEHHTTIQEQQYTAALANQLAERHPGLLAPRIRIPLLRTQLALLIHVLNQEP